MQYTINNLYTLNNYIKKDGDYIVYDIVETGDNKHKGYRLEYVNTFNTKDEAMQYARNKRLFVTEKRFIVAR